MVRIAVFTPNKAFFGHLILEFSFLHHLRQANPDSKIVVYSTVNQVILLQKLGLCDDVVLYKKGGANLELIKQLRKFKPTHIYNLRPYSLYIQLIIVFFRRAFKVGFASGAASKLFYNKVVNYNNSIYKANLYLSLLDMENAENSFSYFDQFNEPLEFNEPHIFTFMPGGGEGEHKKWGIGNFLELAAMILKQLPSSRIIFILGPMEKEEIQQIEKANTEGKYTTLISPEISTITSVAKQSIAVVANDCGPSHVAQMTDCNYIGVWGWGKQHPIRRIAEWSYPSEKSIHLVAKFCEDIKTISPMRVFKVVKGLL